MVVISLLIILTSQQAWAAVIPGFCRFNPPEHPHISGFNWDQHRKITIKTGTKGSCDLLLFPEPVIVTPRVTLEVQNPFNLWDPYVVGPAIPKNIQNAAQIWGRNELVADGPCVPGTYRGSLFVSSETSGKPVQVMENQKTSDAIPIDCKLKNVAMVIDDTGSMSDDISRIRSALSSHIDSQPEDEYTSWNLISFKDSTSNIGTTEDRREILNLVGGLTASGGGDCPEDVLGGISSGLNALGNDPNYRRQMFVATDAAARVGDVDGIIAKAQSNGVNVNVLLRGDCGFASNAAATISAATDTSDFVSSQVVLKRIAEETGGKYFYLPDGTDDQIKAAVKEIFDTFANPPPPPSPPVNPNPTPSPSSAPSSSSSGGGCMRSITGTGDAMLPILFLVAIGLFVMSLRRRGPMKRPISSAL